MPTAKQVTAEELQQLYETFASLSDPQDIEALMEDMCTIREIHEMAQRLSVAFMLDSGESYIAIQDKTNASATTIARVSKSLNYGAKGYRKIIDDEKQREKKE